MARTKTDMREAVMAAARATVQAHGYNALSFRDLAKGVGIKSASVHYQTLMLLIALVSILWATAVAFTTQDARLVVAYSSVAQLSFITLGIFSLRPEGVQGAILQMVNHGLVTASLFFIVAVLAMRAGGSERIRDMGGSTRCSRRTSCRRFSSRKPRLF